LNTETLEQALENAKSENYKLLYLF
jgi:hypothetical protein